jgi:Arc/MetJ family transcription regulator
VFHRTDAGGLARAVAVVTVARVEALKTTSDDANNDASKGVTCVRTTVALDDDLVRDAEAFTGIREKSTLIREALKALIERESARRLARLGGSEPGLSAVPRRRSEPA